MTPSDAKALVDRWLLAKLDEDADLRDLPEGSRHEVLVFRRTDPTVPDVIVKTLTRTEADRLAQELPLPDYEDDKTFGQFGWSYSTLAGEGEYVATDMSNVDIAREGIVRPNS